MKRNKQVGRRRLSVAWGGVTVDRSEDRLLFNRGRARLAARNGSPPAISGNVAGGA